jgi:outer membrane protein assembly factor BamE (lipoprotein component of BamABCDE complex)
MKPTIVFFLPLTAFLCLGCETPGGAYVKRHPELSPQQRKILTERKITDVNAVAGLTKEQIRLAMGEPTQFDSIEGGEAWIFVRLKSDRSSSSSGPSGTEMGTPGVGGSGMAPSMGPKERIENGNVRTTIFFEGDRAVRATVTYDPLAE